MTLHKLRGKGIACERRNMRSTFGGIEGSHRCFHNGQFYHPTVRVGKAEDMTLQESREA